VQPAQCRRRTRAWRHVRIRGLIVRGPAAGRNQAFVLARDWLGAPPPAMGREAARYSGPTA
jgi:hypothetical protein